MNRKSKILLSQTMDTNPVKDRLISDLLKLDYIEVWRGHDVPRGRFYSEIILQSIIDSDYFIQIHTEEQEQQMSDRIKQIRELEVVAFNKVLQQTIRVIIAVTSGNINTHLIKNGVIALNFNTDYEQAFSYLSQLIKVNESDSIIQFQLDVLTDEKSIFLITNGVSEKLVNYFLKHPNELKAIDRRLFEEFVAELFWGFGFQVELTQQTRDRGRDIIAIKNAETTMKYLIECKRPDIGNKIGIKPVRELFGVKQDEKATKAILATTSYFTKDAHQFFERNKWELELKDFDGIMNWIKQYKKIKENF